MVLVASMCFMSLRLSLSTSQPITMSGQLAAVCAAEWAKESMKISGSLQLILSMDNWRFLPYDINNHILTLTLPVHICAYISPTKGKQGTHTHTSHITNGYNMLVAHSGTTFPRISFPSNILAHPTWPDCVKDNQSTGPVIAPTHQ